MIVSCILVRQQSTTESAIVGSATPRRSDIGSAIKCGFILVDPTAVNRYVQSTLARQPNWNPSCLTTYHPYHLLLHVSPQITTSGQQPLPTQHNSELGQHMHVPEFKASSGQQYYSVFGMNSFIQQVPTEVCSYLHLLSRNRGGHHCFYTSQLHLTPAGLQKGRCCLPG